MDIKTMHEMIETLVCCAKAEMDKKGIEELDTEEMGKVVDIIKDLSEAHYYRTISQAMEEEAESGEEYEREDRKGYRGQPRDSMGRYRSRRGRRGYEDRMPMYDEDAEWMRDMDKHMGRMYYTDAGGNVSGGMASSRGQAAGGMNSGNIGGSGGNMGYEDGMRNAGRDVREGRSGQSRRSYMETKDMHRGNGPEDKQTKLRELDKYIAELGSDITDMISDASPEEKNLLKTKLTTLATKIS